MSNTNDGAKDVLQITCFFSVVGCIFVIASYLISEEGRVFPASIPMFISISALCMHLICLVATFTDHSTENGVCKFQAIALQFFIVSLIWWTLVSFITLHRSLIYNVPWRYIQENYWFFHAIVWGIALLFSFIPLAFDMYGQLESLPIICWINSSLDKYIFTWSHLLLLAMGSLYHGLSMLRFMSTFTDEFKDLSVFFRRQVFLCLCFATMLCMVVWYGAEDDGGEVSSIALYAFVLSNGLVGTLCFFIFGFTSSNYDAWREFLGFKDVPDKDDMIKSTQEASEIAIHPPSTSSGSLDDTLKTNLVAADFMRRMSSK